MSVSDIRFTIPMRVVSVANLREHWRAKAMRVRNERGIVEMFARVNGVDRTKAPHGLVVTFTRIAPRRLDDDNLRSALKAHRDSVAAVVGVDDGSPFWTWRYEQRKAHAGEQRLATGGYGVEIAVQPREADVLILGRGRTVRASEWRQLMPSKRRRRATPRVRADEWAVVRTIAAEAPAIGARIAKMRAKLASVKLSKAQ